MKATRFCPNCDKPVDWIKVRPVGANRNRSACVNCGAATRRIKGRRKKDTMPAGLYSYRQKVKVANDLWRHLIYKKAKDGKCARCGHAVGLQAMHVFPKGRYPHMRFDLDNGIPGCSGCHRLLTNDHEAHKNLAISYLGEPVYERLRLLSISRAKADIDLTIIYLKRKTDEGTTVQTGRESNGV